MKMGEFTLVAAGFLVGLSVVVVPITGARAIKTKDFAACQNMPTQDKQARCLRAVAAQACKAVRNRSDNAACIDRTLKKHAAGKYSKRG